MLDQGRCGHASETGLDAPGPPARRCPESPDAGGALVDVPESPDAGGAAGHAGAPPEEQPQAAGHQTLGAETAATPNTLAPAAGGVAAAAAPGTLAPAAGGAAAAAAGGAAAASDWAPAAGGAAPAVAAVWVHLATGPVSENSWNEVPPMFSFERSLPMPPQVSTVSMWQTVTTAGGQLPDA